MEPSHKAHCYGLGISPTEIDLPNFPPLKYGTRLKLSSLVPEYVDPYGFDANEIPSKLYFTHLAVAIQTSENNWLEKILTFYPKDLPLRDDVTGTTILHVAAKIGNEMTLKILLQNTEILQLLNEADLRGTTPLIVASWFGNFEALKYFLSLGCETEAYITDSRKNALHCAADLNNAQFCIQLLKYNSEKQFIDAVDASGNSPLMIAAREGSPCLTDLLRAGANHRYQSKINGRNVMHVAIVFFKQESLKALLKEVDDIKFWSTPDWNNDTPFLLALKSSNYSAIKELITNVPINVLLMNCYHCIRYLIKYDETAVLGIIMAVSTELDFLNLTDSKGRTPLMYAIELERSDCIHLILSRPNDLSFRNTLTDETILHFAARTKNVDIIKTILLIPRIDEIINICDQSSKTAFEVALSSTDEACYSAFIESGYVKKDFLNKNNESSLFIAAKLGNYKILLNLLLSEKFLSFQKYNKEITRIELIRAELQGCIYASDLYITYGKTLTKRGWNRVPDQKYLFEKNNDNRNIYHACVIGEDLMCLTFVYIYCVHFNDYWQELDQPDKNGATPLLIAAKSGHSEICKFLVQHGANIIRSNLNGEYPLKEMHAHIPDFKDLFREMINECVTEDTSKKGLGKSFGELAISNHILCPPEEKQMHVTKKIFQIFERAEYIDFLQSPVLEYFIESKWIQLRSLILLRFHINIVTVALTFLYLSITISWFDKFPIMVALCRLATFCFCVISIFINVPHLFMEFSSLRRKLFTFSILASPACTVIYLLMKPNKRLSLEVGSLAIICSGVSTFIYAVDTPLGSQLAIFYEVLVSIFKHMPLSLILIFSFSLCFFILFHDDFNFSNPVSSLLYTIMVILDGDAESLPTFQKSHYTNNQEKAVGLREEFPSIFIEGFILIMFKILISISLLNMLIGLSVTGATDLEKSGKVQMLWSKVCVLYEWESFSQSNFYKRLSKSYFVFLFGLKYNLSEALLIPIVIYPEINPLEGFDIHRLENIATKKQDITSVEVKFLEENIFRHSEVIGYYKAF